ncbi:MAG: hypothetical protein IIV41_04905 [Akkermansia sp.]|nr:hypothetical protein [Akkermansia sp.]
MKTHITWVEGVALLVEKKLPLGHIGWLVVYGIALLAILPIMINLGLGTGWTAFAYASEGFYASKPFSAETTLLINLFCTLLGWFFCCWSILLFRCLRRYWNFAEYEAPCPLWISGCVLLAQLALLGVALCLLTAGGLYWSLLPLILIALLACLRHRISQSS